MRMKEEVLSHFADDNKPEIAGFLLSELLPHTQALGYEVLLLKDAISAVDLHPGDGDKAIKEIVDMGVFPITVDILS